MRGELTASLQRLQQKMHDAGVAGEANPVAPPGAIEAIEMFHRLAAHCPLDVVADALTAWVAPCVAAARISAAAFTDAVVSTVLGAAHVTLHLRTRLAAAESELASNGGVVRVGEFTSALAEARRRLHDFEAELGMMQDTHLQACEAFLAKASVHQRQLEERDDEITRLNGAVASATTRIRTLEAEVAELRSRMTAESQAVRESLLDESARSNALRGAWRTAEVERDVAREAVARLAADTAAVRARCALELHEAEERARAALEMARGAVQLSGLEPFKKAVATAARLRSVLMTRGGTT
jgi:hypothetical protein